MRPVRLLLLPVVLPAALWACGHDPDPALERVQGRAMLFAEPASTPALPPAGPRIDPCPETDGTGDQSPPHDHQVRLEIAHGRPWGRLLQTSRFSRVFSPESQSEGDALVQFNPIYQSQIVRIARWSCDGHSRTPGEPAWSREPTFAFVLHGLFRRHLGKAEVLAAPGDSLFFPGDSEYRTSHPLDGGDHGIGIRVEPGTVEEILGRAGYRKADPHGLVRARVLIPPRAVLRLRQLIDSLEEERPAALDVDETALLLLGQAAGGIVESSGGSAGRVSTRRAHRKAVERVIEMVQARLQERLGLEEIAREAAYSPYHLCRVFRDQTGMTIHGYVNRQRLLRALEISRTEENIALLAVRVGFASHSHLTSVFKQNIGRPPSRLSTGDGSERLGVK